jgi:hypothetical protein
MIDLVVSLRSEERTISIVFVQVKASTRGAEHFRENLKSRLKRGGEGNTSCAEWMLQNKMILIIGDTFTSRSGKTTRKLTDDEIIQSFNEQLEKIDRYWGSQSNHL